MRRSMLIDVEGAEDDELADLPDDVRNYQGPGSQPSSSIRNALLEPGKAKGTSLNATIVLGTWHAIALLERLIPGPAFI